MYERDAAYLCVCGGRSEYGSFAEFITYTRSLAPVFDCSDGTLQAQEFKLVYQSYPDETQYVE